MLRMRDLPVSRKLAAGFTTLGLLVLAVGGTGAVELHRAQGRLETMYEDSVTTVRDLGSVQTAFNEVAKDLDAYALAVDDSARQDVATDQAADDETLDAAWAAYQQHQTALTSTQLETFTTDLAAYRAARDAAAPLVDADDYATFAQQRASTVLPADEKVNSDLEAMVEQETTVARASRATGAQDYHRALALIVAIVVIAFVAAVVIGLVIARGISRPLAAVVDVVRGLADGRLDQRLNLDRGDEVGQMAQALDASTERLGTVLARIVDGASGLATSSAQLTAVSAQMSSGADQASAQTQVVSAATEQITANIGTVAAAGEEMTAAIREISMSTADASGVAATAVTAAASADETLARLSASSEEIGAVVKLITSIAEQTNLLALNATIEAARAGEAGRGFAVVAGEVKELAQQTARATEDITSRVAATQSDAGAAAAAIAQITEVIARIDALQGTIAAAVEEQSATTSEMVRNVTEVSAGAQEISVNMTGIATAAQESSSSAQDTDNASQDIARIAADLRQLVAGFRY